MKFYVAMLTVLVVTLSAGQSNAPAVPMFRVDSTWPPALPNKWVLGSVSSFAVDRQDHVWMLHRPRTVAEDKRDNAAPPVIEFDADGRFVRAWGGPGSGYEWPDNEHGIYVDDRDTIWIGGNAGPGAALIAEPWRSDDMLLSFTSDGRFLKRFGRREQGQGNADRSNLREPADVVLYRRTNELFVADGYGNRRVVVLDADTLMFKRAWGAFGNIPIDVYPPAPAPKPYRQLAAPDPATVTESNPTQFWIVHSLKVSTDGLVYVGDRQNRRVQVFGLDGTYRAQFMLTPSNSSANSLALSPDADQQLLYVADVPNSRILFVNRRTLSVVGEFRTDGLAPHHMAVDSKGNIYAAQLNDGSRKLAFSGTSRR